MSTEIIQGIKLSPQQRRLWLLQVGREYPYIAQCTVLLEGMLHSEHFVLALREVVQRHEILRTTFQQLPGMIVPLQVINETGALPLDDYDLSGWDVDQQELSIEALLSQARQVRLDFEHGPLMQLSLLNLGMDRHLLIISATSLYADAMGLRSLVGEIERCYAAGLHREVLSEAPLQYADLSEIFNELLKAEDTKAGREYWDKQDLTGLQNLKLFCEKNVSGAECLAPRQQSVTIQAEELKKIEAVAQERNVPLSVFLLACWQVLLWRLSGQPKMVVGAVTSGRNYEELETSLGLFDRCLPVQCHLEEDLRFTDILQQVRDKTREVYAWQESFAWEQVMNSHQNGSAPFLPFCFDYQPTIATHTVDGLTFSIRHQSGYVELFKLMLTCLDLGATLRAEFHYDSALYTGADIARLGAQFETLVRSVAENVEGRIGELEIVGAAERQEQLAEWNSTARRYPQECIHEMFERQALQTPEAVAVVYEQEQLTYAELNQRANQLAHHLHQLGVRAEVPVGLCVERSVEMMVGVLGILKAGGAYVPLDPQYPRERLRFMLADTGAAVLLTQQHLRNRMPPHEAQMVLLDSEWESIAQQSDENLAARVQPANLAYVIYTSGSSGTPKGVGVEHRQLCNYIHAILEALALKPPASFATVSTLAADLGNTALYPALCSGGALHIISAERAGDAALLGEYFHRHHIDLLKIVPSHLAALTAGADAAQVLPRQRLVLGGEAPHPELVRRVGALSASCQVVNHYGPTETTVGVLTHKLPRPLASERNTALETEATLPLGRPLANTAVYLLDRHLRLVPVGAVGEVYIGGAGVSRGYLNRPDLTAEKFIPHPFSEAEGARLYRTGDMGRYLAEGNVEFLGRIDKQVKLRGYRIELGEIEAALRTHEAVRDAAVVVSAREGEAQRLLGYVVLERKYLEVIDGRRRYGLPNGMAIVQQNKNETDYQYREIFTQESYLRHGITLKKDMCVFDVGANIGMFTLFIGERCPRARIYAFEPIAEVCHSLRINAELYGTEVKVFEYGISDEEREETFTFYPRQSMMSGVSEYADAAYEKEVVKLSMRNEQQQGHAEGMELLLAEADELLDKRFGERAEHCQLRRLSEVMRAESVTRIDLLKIDVQGAEMDVLRGIDENDWNRIGQVVLEVHDRKGGASEGRLERARKLLEAYGFAVVVNQEDMLTGTDRFNVYAVRDGWWTSTIDEATSAEDEAGEIEHSRAKVNKESTITSADLRRYLRERVPEYMIPTWVIVLDAMPLTPNGKLDRCALPWPKRGGSEEEKGGEALTAVEEIVAGIWAEVLKSDGLDVEANFFELGGHSLLATQVMSHIREAFGIGLHLVSLFESPTVRGLAGQVEIAIQTAQGVKTPPLERVARTAQLPLSFAQQRLWFLHQLEPESSFYHCPATLRLSGPLNVSALQQTFAEIIRRHEVLRTTFPARHGEPMQVIAPSLEFELPLTDLSQIEPGKRESVARRLAEEAAEQPFDLAGGPLLRASLLKLGAEEHIVLFTMHHIVSDGWSMGVLIKEVSVLYEAYSRGEASPLRELPIQYADYAVWQREWLQGEVLAEQLNYWREQLRGVPEVLELPTDRVRPAVQNYRGAQQRFSLPAEVSHELKRLSRQQGVTLFMTLLAAWQVLLWRYTGQSEIVVGSPIAGRNSRETENLIGFFVNTLVLRTELRADETFTELLRRVRRVTLEAYAHQDVPFEKLVEELQPERNLSHTPLFQVMLVLQNAPTAELDLGELQLSATEEESQTAKFDLTLALKESDGALRGALNYNTELFEPEIIERLLGHFQQLLTQVAGDPESRLSQLRLTTEAEEQQLLVEWNETASAYPEGSIAQLFEAQVARTPEAVALIFGAEEVSYAELNRRANQLAHYLRQQGVSLEMVVGVMLERSVELVVSLLAILKAGGAYLALDPEYPIERLAFMVEDAAVPLLVAGQQQLDALPAQHAEVLSRAARILCLDSERAKIRQENESNPASGATADNLAYVIYTSGSSGRPKGVSVTQRAVIRLVKETDFCSFSSTDVFLQLAPVSFDASTFELWGSLLNGARLIVMPPQSTSLVELGSALKRYGVTTLWLTAGLFHLMVDERLPDLLGVRQLLAGGDVLSAAHVERFLEAATESVLINGYGPTENTTFSCTHRMGAGWKSKNGSVPIGRPISNTQVYVLDERLQPAPIGVVGELYLAGDGLARAYVGRPEFTAEKFVPHPHSTEPGARLYGTGDRVRYSGDGTLEFLGRVDEQVKVRGFRVELGEVEAVLDQCRGVSRSIVVSGEGLSCEKRLVAYVVPDGDVKPTTQEIFSFLQKKLPTYMLPSAVVIIDELPLTPNGKVDRRALPVPEIGRNDSTQEYATPQTQIEELMSEIWAGVMKREQVSMSDNFFDLGGHSLIATQLISRVREAFNVELSVRSLFATPTVRGLAEAVVQELSERQGQAAPPLKPVGRGGQLPLSYAQQRLWFADQLRPDTALYNVPVAVRLSGPLNIAALEQTLTEIIRRHEVLRTTFPAKHGEPMQVIATAVNFSLPVSDLSGVEAEERESVARRLAEEEAARPFDLAAGPLLRAGLLRLGDEEHIALFTMHHIVSDGWSMSVLINEVSVLYEAYSRGEGSPLRELPIQYADYAVWQREWLQGDVLAEQLNYWREQLRGVPEALELPADKPRPAVQTHRGAHHAFSFTPELSDQLKAWSRRQSATLFMTLLAAFTALLHYYSGQEDIVVGIDVANRNGVEVEGLIGFLINILVTRIKVSGNPTFRQLLMTVRETMLGAYAHQELPFERLVEELRPERSLSGMPLIQSMFSFHNTPPAELRLPDLTVNPLELDSSAAKRELTLFMSETEQGLAGTWTYNSDLFTAASIKRLSDHFEKLMKTLIAQPDERLQDMLKVLAEADREQAAIDKKDRRVWKLKQFMSVPPKAVDLSAANFISTGHLTPEDRMPLVVRPCLDDVDLVEWAKSQQPFIKARLLEYGAILFRGFSTRTALEFEQFALSICPDLFGEYGDLPREGVSGNVYGSTPYPADQAILFHNESSHLHRWPLKIWFFCLQAAQQGGETPIVDCRKVYELLNPKLRERFAKRKLMYVRNYTKGLDVSWQEFFRTSDKAAVENYCRQASIAFGWTRGDGLRTRQVCHAVVQHPKTNETVFFNQLQAHHVSCLEPATRASLLSLLKEEDLPRNVYYGDGSAIEDSVVDEVREVYQQLAINFPWQEGDILMLDNMLTAHGRNAYTGERKIVVAMGEMIANKDVEPKETDR
jgi:amino acid adenylation domain-containing protein/FkbM family methyltransferase